MPNHSTIKPDHKLSTRTTDVVIVGGGLVGGSLAIALADAGFNVIVADQLDQRSQLNEEFDGRASAIALAPKKMLAKIGMWKYVGDDTAPIKDIRVADGNSPLFLHYDHADIGEEALGYMVENRHLRRAIFARIDELPRITYLAPVKINEIERTATGVATRLANGEIIRAPLIIGADGRGSQIRQQANIDLIHWSYHQTGIVLTAAHEIPHHNVAHEHFLPAGPFAILPLPSEGGTHRSSIVWTEKEDLAADILALPEDLFLNEFSNRFGDFLGELSLTGPRWSYPLTLQYATTSISDRLALAGDSAHAMHPIAGQGLNMGLRDVAALAQVLTDAGRLGMDIGAPEVLAKYETWRRFDNALMLALTDGLTRLFSNDIAPVKLARDLGLAAVNRAGPLKKFFMGHAMGKAGDLPRLLKGDPL